MSEDEAQRRCRAARLCRPFPVLFEMLADASIHLTGILLLGPHLTEDNHREVLARARYRSKREIEKLVAELADESSVPSPASLPEAEPAPARAMHYEIQFTADERYLALLDEARDLLAHVKPTRDFVEVQRRALEVLVAQLRQRRHADRAGAAPEPERDRASAAPEQSHMGAEPGRSERSPVMADADGVEVPGTRRPSAAAARAVWQRDQGRCSYGDPRGQRCRETSRLEYHHQHAWALGGATTADNLTLRCTAHNALAAEEDFGRQRMRRRRRGHG